MASELFADQVGAALLRMPNLRSFAIHVAHHEEFVAVLKTLDECISVGQTRLKVEIACHAACRWPDLKPSSFSSKHPAVKLACTVSCYGDRHIAQLLETEPFGATKLDLTIPVSSDLVPKLAASLCKNRWIRTLKLRSTLTTALELLSRAAGNTSIRTIHLECEHTAFANHFTRTGQFAQVLHQDAFPNLCALRGFELAREEALILFRSHGCLAKIGRRNVYASRLSHLRKRRDLADLAFERIPTSQIPLDWISSDSTPRLQI
jgi:hypothetical protein